MSLDIKALCGVQPGQPVNRAACVLLPLGAAASLLPWTPPWAALFGGTVIALAFGNPCVGLTGRSAKWLLQIAVVGLGAGVNLGVVARVGGAGLGYTIAGLVATFAIGSLLATWLGIAPKVAALICAGTGLCGGSAIAAAAPAIGAKSEETSAALAVVFLLNGAALFIFPAVGTWLGMDAHQFGLWCALAIHDTSSVTGAAMTHGTQALATATTVKLARALWIVPVALALGAWFRRGAAETDAKRRRTITVPWFIAGFLIVSMIFTFIPALAPAAKPVSRIARSMLTVTLFFIGMGLSRTVLRMLGLRPLIHAVVLWIIIGGGTLVAIQTGLIR